MIPGRVAQVVVCLQAAPKINPVHYANAPVQYTAIFHGCKNDNFQLIFIPPANCVCGWVYGNTLSVYPSMCPSVRNVLFS